MEKIMNDFILQALIGGVLVALAAGPMGCLLVWRRMAYFGDSMAHSALLGVAIGLVMGLSHSFGIIVICIGFTILLGWLESYGNLATDTLLGILAHSTLSLGLIGISLMHHPVNLEAILFGDILTITHDELSWILFGVCVIYIVLYTIWSQLILVTLHTDLAFAEGVQIKKIKWLFMGLLSLMVAFSVQIIGILLLMALMIIPAAAARQWSKSPNRMASIAVVIGIVSVCLGIWLSIQLDVPSAPCIVLCSTAFFILSLLSKVR